MEIIKLPDKFIGKADVKGFKFEKFKESESAYIYKVYCGDYPECHYEVFEKLIYPVFEDFMTRKIAEGKFYESYPKTKAFGKSAWCCRDINKALNIFDSITKENESKKKNPSH